MISGPKIDLDPNMIRALYAVERHLKMVPRADMEKPHMKLILCEECRDVVKIGVRGERRYCLCGKSWGVYKEDDHHALIGGYAIPIGLGNGSLQDAVANRPEKGRGHSLIAWVFPKHFERIEEQS